MHEGQESNQLSLKKEDGWSRDISKENMEELSERRATLPPEKGGFVSDRDAENKAEKKMKDYTGAETQAL